MLPRRHILDVLEIVDDKKQILSMSTLTVALDAIKYIDEKSKNDHLAEALELNEFVCFMYPGMRPKNRSLLFHVVSDLLGLLMYGVPRKSKRELQNLETMNYSEKNIEIYPVIEVYNDLKEKVYTKKHGSMSIVDGFIKKIRIEMDIIERVPLVEEIFMESKIYMKEWLPAFSDYYDKKKKTVMDSYERWWELWKCDGTKESKLESMVDRLAAQSARDFGVELDRQIIFEDIMSDEKLNKAENEAFSRWYTEGVNFLLKI